MFRLRNSLAQRHFPATWAFLATLVLASGCDLSNEIKGANTGGADTGHPADAGVDGSIGDSGAVDQLTVDAGDSDSSSNDGATFDSRRADDASVNDAAVDAAWADDAAVDAATAGDGWVDDATVDDAWVDDAGTDDAGTLCQGIDCSGHGSCVVDTGAARCLCAETYVADGLSCVADTVAPSTPLLLAAEYISSSQTDLSWQASTDNAGVVLYRIYRKLAADAEFTLLDTSERENYQDRSVVSGQDLVYVVSAVDAAQNESARSNEASVPDSGGLSGTISDSDGPIAGLAVFIYAGPCHDREVANTHTNALGEYSFASVPASDVYILAYPALDALNYFNTWWTQEPAGTRLCRSAAAVTILPGQPNDSHDMLLIKGASISGTVTHNGAPLEENVSIRVNTGTCANPVWDGSPGSRGAAGEYLINRLPEGTVYVVVQPAVSSELEEQWWDGSDGTSLCEGAQGVSVLSGQTVADIDFALRLKDTSGLASVAGRVTYQGSPVEGLKMIAYSGQCGSGYLGAEADTDANGDYVIDGIEVGEVYVKACPTCRGGLFAQPNSWWDGSNGSGICENGVGVALTMGQRTGDINFILQEPGTLSGRVVLDGLGVQGVLVHGYQQRCDVNYLSGTITSAGGLFSLSHLPAGGVFVRTSAQNQHTFTFTDEWYDGGQSTASCTAATPVNITAGQNTADVEIFVEQ